jgi:hypothetical protein
MHFHLCCYRIFNSVIFLEYSLACEDKKIVK